MGWDLQSVHPRCGCTSAGIRTTPSFQGPQTQAVTSATPQTHNIERLLVLAPRHRQCSKQPWWDRASAAADSGFVEATPRGWQGFCKLAPKAFHGSLRVSAHACCCSNAARRTIGFAPCLCGPMLGARRPGRSATPYSHQSVAAAPS